MWCEKQRHETTREHEADFPKMDLEKSLQRSGKMMVEAVLRAGKE